MSNYLRWALVKRFVAVVRQEGLGHALHRVGLYLGRQLRGFGPSVLRAKGTATAPEAYLQGTWADIARGGGFHAPRDRTGPPKIALIGDLNLSQCRKYRVEQLAAFWQAQGVACDYAHYEDIPRCVRLLQEATHLCEYRLEATPLTQMYRYEARRLGLPVLYDIDDPLFSVSAYETYHNMAALEPGLKAHFLSVAPRYAQMMNSADMVTLSTPGLVEHARLYTPRPVHMRRNFADEQTLADGAQAIEAVQKTPDDALFRVVFASGSQGHEADFEIIAEAMEAFVTAASDRRLMVLGHFRLDLLPSSLRARTEHHKFLPYEEYLEHLARADVAVMPLQDDLFNRCKSAVRVIDAASVGLVSVVSDVGDLANLVEDGTTGYVARQPDDWLNALENLAQDRAKTRTMGQAARAQLETHWAGQPAPHIIDPEVLDWVRT
ncbi:glycosyltransferase [Roseovarius sp. 2305UL8-3]|uniref:glycosyltransferase n=1 Tax=Roseovarius conchicola TaxID=3121636 RepID=UPI003528FFC4